MVRYNDQYSNRTDLTRTQKWRLRHPDQSKIDREYSRKYSIENPNALKDWRERNPEKYKEQGKRSNKKQRLRKYKLTQEEYDNLLTFQNKLCAICKKEKSHKHDWHIDHCHITGKVRGILCSRCNTLIGQSKESIATLNNAIEYLRVHGKE